MPRPPISRLVLAAAALAAGVAGCGGWLGAPAVAPAPEADEIRARLDRPPPVSGNRYRHHRQWLHGFYERRDFRPAWHGPSGPQARAHELVTALERAREHGLDPAAYGASALGRALRARRDPAVGSAGLDVALSAAFLAYADDLRRGAVDPSSTSPSWRVLRSPADLSGLLETAIGLNEVAATLRRLEPQRLEYRRLQVALTETGDPQLQDRLRANLERWRWLPRDLGSRYLLVRIADFELDLVDDGVPVTRRVIVGEPFRQTPQFSSHITHLVVHPAWYVPPKIAAEELEPALRADPTALDGVVEVWTTGSASHRVAADSVDWTAQATDSPTYRFVQPPGAANPLGRVKFVLPNPFAVYLHDTPGTGLFERDDRDLSHGCIRVEGASALARELLVSDPAALAAFDDLLAAGSTGRIDLPEPLPTYLMYWTVSVTPAGETRFLRDLYGADERLLAALDDIAGARPWVDDLTPAPPAAARGDRR